MTVLKPKKTIQTMDAVELGKIAKKRPGLKKNVEQIISLRKHQAEFEKQERAEAKKKK